MRPNAGKAGRAAKRPRDIRALELRLIGWTYQAIADKLEMSNRMTAQRAVNRELDRLAGDSPKRLREKQSAQINLMLRKHMPRAIGANQFDDRGKPAKGNVTYDQRMKAAELCLKLLTRQARLYGVDKPIEISGPKGKPIAIAMVTTDLNTILADPVKAQAMKELTGYAAALRDTQNGREVIKEVTDDNT